ncbi:DUF3221 domain-containing protein [Wansuia hejianensis]|uniref:DUF3221 domain-containing protein n=1 Tax=Wansuia hejianensis TaxID=2763667 RepID=A0A926EWI1_9FIRM|nr:DUF3221 domain-containing protein [Wansuia hejianensis]MBC8589775.1 DUF3221 domain-containing protein [Wansuia hejianensis]
MIKRICYRGIILIFLVISLIGCNNSGKSQYFFNGTVLENNETHLLVKPEEGTDELKSSDKITVSLKETSLLNTRDEKVKIRDIKEGQKVQISYDGMIAESYPAQIKKCDKIKILD